MFVKLLVRSLFVVIGLLASQGLCQQGGSTSCPGSPQPLISGSMYRVEDDQFSADSSYDGDYLPHDARITSESWCSANTGGPYWIEVDFERDVIIHELQIGGHDGFLLVNSYLRTFQVEYGPDDDQLTPILQDNTPRVFSRPSEHGVQTTLLPSPIVTRVLRIIPVDWSQSVPCVRLEALGCIYVPATTVPPTTPTSPQPTTTETDQDNDSSTTSLILPTTTQTTVSSSLTQATPTITSSIAQATPTTNNPNIGGTGANIGPAVGGAMGGVVLLVILILIMVLLVACLVAKNRATKKRLEEVYYSESGTVHVVDNELYGKDTPPASPTVEYATPKPTSVQEQNLYETVGSPAVYTYAAVDSEIKITLPDGTRSTPGTLKMDTLPPNEETSETDNTYEELPTDMDETGDMDDNAAYSSNTLTAAQDNAHEETQGLINNPMYGTLDR